MTNQNKIPEPPEILKIAEHKPSIITVRDFHENGREGFRIVWPHSQLREETYIDFYLTEENGKYKLISQMSTFGPKRPIQDFNENNVPDKSKLLEMAYECAMDRAGRLADDLKDRVEDKSSYASKTK